MKALQFRRALPRFAAARSAGELAAGAGAKVGPLKLVDIDEPSLPGPGWQRVRPRLSGICGSDLSTIDGRASPPVGLRMDTMAAASSWSRCCRA